MDDPSSMGFADQWQAFPHLEGNLDLVDDPPGGLDLHGGEVPKKKDASQSADQIELRVEAMGRRAPEPALTGPFGFSSD